MEDIFDVNQALEILKEKVVIKDNLKNKFVCRKNKIWVYSSNSSYSLNFKDFIELFKEHKFMIEDFDDSTIDTEKDKEYYNFKHK